MKTMILAGAAALALTAVPAAADDHMEGEAYTLSADQTTIYDGWPEDRRTTYDAWPPNIQEFYWTLTPAQTEGWWVLTDPQRVRVYEMTPEQRAMAWQQISGQMSSMETTSAPAAPASTSANQPRFVRSEVTQTTPAGYSAAASGEELPVCTPQQQDGCINSWEKNKTGNRPLEYWPGRPASEIDGPLPATQAEYDSMSKSEDDSDDDE